MFSEKYNLAGDVSQLFIVSGKIVRADNNKEQLVKEIVELESADVLKCDDNLRLLLKDIIRTSTSSSMYPSIDLRGINNLTSVWIAFSENTEIRLAITIIEDGDLYRLHSEVKGYCNRYISISIRNSLERFMENYLTKKRRIGNGSNAQKYKNGIMGSI